MNRYWILVLSASVFEIGWVTGLKHAFNSWTWLGTIVSIYLSMDLLIRATKGLPVGTAYAIFTGIGTAGTVVIEMVFFGVPFRITKVLLILLLLIGVVGLKAITPERETKGARG